MNRMKLQIISARVIDGLENINIPFYCYVLTFFAGVFIRLFVEAFANPMNFFDELNGQVYMKIMVFSMALFALAILEAIMVSKMMAVNITKVLRVLFPAMLFFVSIPLLDIMIYHGHGVQTLWFMPEDSAKLLKAYFTYSSNIEYTSLGQKIGIGIILATLFAYCLTKGASVMKSMFIVILGYTLVFLWAMSFVLIQPVISFLGYEYRVSGILMMRYFFLLNLVLLGVAGYMADKKIFMALFRDMRGSRILFYELFFLLGTILAISITSNTVIFYLHFNPDVVANVILFSISIFFAGMFSLMINNIYDVDIDIISNPSRPLVTGAIDPVIYTNIAYIFLSLALFGASIISDKAFLIIALVVSAYYVYSVPPIRFKRLPVLSKIVIGMNTFGLSLAGFVLVLERVNAYPYALTAICLIGITLVSNYIDLKDMKGDRASGIITLPSLVGETWARHIIGAAYFCVTLGFLFVIRDPRVLPVLVILGLIAYILIIKAQNERLLLWFSNACLASIILVIALQTYII